MKKIKLFFTIILAVLILFSGSCATKKPKYKDGPSSAAVGNTSQLENPPESVTEGNPDTEMHLYEFDVVVDVDPQKMAQPRPDYPEEVTPAQSRSADMFVQESLQAEVTQQQQSQLDSEESAEKIDNTVSDIAADRAFGNPGGPGGKERRNNNLVAQGSVDVEGVMEYIKIRNKNSVLNEEKTRKIINAYVDEAVKEDVNYDFAIAQMLYWTAFLTDKQRIETNNLSGLQSTKTWNGTFPTTEEGVQAHIQHLRRYSYKTLKDPSTKNVDPRRDQISNFSGTIKSFDQLYPKWTQNTDRYKKNIELILKDMYQYSDKKR